MQLIFRRMVNAARGAKYGLLALEFFALVAGILLALAADRWNQERMDAIETARIVDRLRSDTARNLAMFQETIPHMEWMLANVKVLFAALEAGSPDGQDPRRIESALAFIDVIPSYPLVFSAYEELVATGRLRHLDDRILVDLLGDQHAEYKAAQAVVGYWRDGINDTSDVIDQTVDFYYKTELMDESVMGVRYDFTVLSASRNLKNKVFDAVDTHGDWLRLQTSIYGITKSISARLEAL